MSAFDRLSPAAGIAKIVHPAGPIETDAADAESLVLYGYFRREQECRAAVVKLYQQHMPAKIIDFAHDQWLFGEAAAS
jgi:hypothetical protein